MIHYYAESIKSWRILKELYPDDPEPDLRVGEIFMALGKSSEALYPLVEAVSKGRGLKQNKYRFSYFDFQNPK